MITIEEAGSSRAFYHVNERTTRGRLITARANGALKTWVTRPGEFRLPIKIGFYGYGYITHNDANQWTTTNPEDDVAPGIFKTKKFGKDTKRDGLKYALIANAVGLDYPQVCQIIMYYMERNRQGAHQGGFADFITQKAKSGHRYRKGRNGEMYRESGDRLLSQCASLVGLDEDCTDGVMILDRAIEQYKPEPEGDEA